MVKSYSKFLNGVYIPNSLSTPYVITATEEVNAVPTASQVNTVPTSATGYTKTSNSGATLPATAKLGTGKTDWACTQDNKTGLIWDVKTTGGGLRDMNNGYYWYEPDASKNGGFAGYQNGGTCEGSNCDTYALTNAVNAKGLCGKKDWRLPTVAELMKLVVCSDGKYKADGSCTNYMTVIRPTINTPYFPNTPSESFWSSSPIVVSSFARWYVGFDGGSSPGAWSVGFDDGSSAYSNKDGGFLVRLVRG